MADPAKPADAAGPAAAGPSVATLGKGIFDPAGPTDSLVFKMTPKYADPFAGDATRRLARFIVSEDLGKQIAETPPDTQEMGSSLGRDTILSRMQNKDKGYFDFLLQSVEESFDEKFQIVETLGDSYAVFGLGKRPRIFNFQGVLLNSVENDWRVNFIYLVQQYLSISRLSKFRNSKTKNTVTLHYDSMLVQGAILNLRTSLRADNELYIPFGFSMLVTRLEWVDLSKSKVTGPQAPTDTSAANLYPESKKADFASSVDSSELVALNADTYRSESKKQEDAITGKSRKTAIR